MKKLADTPRRYGLVTRTLHWGMAILFAAQFVAAAARAILPKENGIREALWSYHTDLGLTLFLLVLARGVWGIANISRRPPLHSGPVGRAALAGHAAIYTLMVVVPFVRILAAASGTRGLSYFGVPIFPAREAEIAWMQGPSEWHGEMGWLLALLIIGHAGMAVFWHHYKKRDGTLQRML